MEKLAEEGIKNYLEYIAPFVTIIVGLVVYVYLNRTNTLEKKVDDEIKKRDDIHKDSETHCKECLINIMSCIKAANKETLDAFKEGLEVERMFRIDVMTRHEDNIKVIFNKIDDILNKVDQKFENYIESQERICNARHSTK